MLQEILKECLEPLRWRWRLGPGVSRFSENDPWETKNLADLPEYKQRVESMMKSLAAEMKNAGDDLPLTSEHPQPAEFPPPEKKIKTAFPAGGLAPGWEPK